MYYQYKIYGKLINLVNNLDKGIHKTKCKYEHNDKKCEIAGLNTKIVYIFLNTQTLKIISQNMNVYVVKRIIKKSLMKVKGTIL